MKNYLNFTLTGSRLLPIWIAFLLFFLIPYYFLLEGLSELTSAEVSAEGPSKLFFLYLAIVLAMAFAFIFFLTKLVFQSIEYKGTKITCDYTPLRFIGIIIFGLLFSVFTLGIYTPWFIKNIHRFFTNFASYNSNKFSFQGTGFKLFLIMTLTIIVPVIVVGFVVFTILKSDIEIWIYQIIVISIFVSFIYLIFNWMLDFKYKNYLIRLDTEFFRAIGKISIELLLAFILVFIFRFLSSILSVIWWVTEFFPETGKIAINMVLAVLILGFYFPMAFIRLYRYFAEHTKSNLVEGKQILMGYDGDQLSAFFFIWGQVLVTVITLGLYFPWAFSRIVHRVLSQTYVTTNIGAITENK